MSPAPAVRAYRAHDEAGDALQSCLRATVQDEKAAKVEIFDAVVPRGRTERRRKKDQGRRQADESGTSRLPEADGRLFQAGMRRYRREAIYRREPTTISAARDFAGRSRGPRSDDQAAAGRVALVREYLARAAAAMIRRCVSMKSSPRGAPAQRRAARN